MTRRFCLILLTSVAAAQIAKPRVGYIVDRSGNLRTVEGVTGAFTLGPVVEKDVLCAAYSGTSLVIKKDTEILIDGRSLEAPAGSIDVTFDKNGQPAEIFFREAETLWTRQDGAFTAVRAQNVIADLEIREGELVINGVPIRLASQARRVSQMGDRWLVVYATDCIYAVRGGQVYELPEDASE